MAKCEHCDGKKMLRIQGTNLLVPCLKCKAKEVLQNSK